MKELFIKDIPQAVAHTAFYGVSHSPEKRGDRQREDYANTLTQDYETLKAHANTEDKGALLEVEFARYHEGYKARMLKYLYSYSRCMSSFVTGPSNFPSRQQNKDIQ